MKIWCISTSATWLKHPLFGWRWGWRGWKEIPSEAGLSNRVQPAWCWKKMVHAALEVQFSVYKKKKTFIVHDFWSTARNKVGCRGVFVFNPNLWFKWMSRVCFSFYSWTMLGQTVASLRRAEQTITVYVTRGCTSDLLATLFHKALDAVQTPVIMFVKAPVMWMRDFKSISLLGI